MIFSTRFSISNILKENDAVSYLNNDELLLVERFRMLSKEKADALLLFIKTLTD